jgi:hypothetical protein
MHWDLGMHKKSLDSKYRFERRSDTTLSFYDVLRQAGLLWQLLMDLMKEMEYELCMTSLEC